MSLTWSFPCPHGEPCNRWWLSPVAGRPLESIDPKLLMRLGDELADRLAAIEPGRTPGGSEVYIVWEDQVAAPCPQ